MEVDKKMGIDVYEQIPVMESEKFLLREIEDDGDAEDLLKVYSDKDAVPLFNSDNCVNGFYYTSIEKMKDTIAFWKREYQSRYYVRWAIIDKNANCAIGTIELFNRRAKDYFNNCGLLRLDLRSDYELVHQPHSLKGYKDIEYYHINLLQNENMSVLPNDIKDYQDLSGFYIFMIEANKKQLKKVFNIFLNHPYDCTLFNCSAGKDRTGVIACMLLDLAGCHEYDIVKDYSESYENNMAMIKQLEEMIPSEDEKFLGSDPRVMMKFIAYLRENYGSTKGYLLNIGFSDEEIEEIKENFII